MASCSPSAVMSSWSLFMTREPRRNSAARRRFNSSFTVMFRRAASSLMASATSSGALTAMTVVGFFRMGRIVNRLGHICKPLRQKKGPLPAPRTGAACLWCGGPPRTTRGEEPRSSGARAGKLSGEAQDSWLRNFHGLHESAHAAAIGDLRPRLPAIGAVGCRCDRSDVLIHARQDSRPVSYLPVAAVTASG